MDLLFGEIRNLVKKINKVSNGQARIVEIGESMNIINIEISPNDGLYKGASFLFKIRVDPYKKTEGPTVLCLTPIYHPNIDTSDLEDILPVDDDDDFSSNACLNMFDNWQPGYGLDGMINGLLFFFYHPEIDDPLSPYISPGMSYEEFSENVRRSLLGEEVDGFFFERNLCDKEYEILRKEFDKVSELNIGNHDPVLPSAEGAKESPMKDSEMIHLPNIEITMLPNTDIDAMVVCSEDSQAAGVPNCVNEIAIVPNEDTCKSTDENKYLLPDEASNAKTKIFHNFRVENDLCSIKSFDRSIPESDFLHVIVDKFLQRFFCCHSDLHND